MLATTHPQTLLPTIRTRTSEIKLGRVSAVALTELVNQVCKKEKVAELDEEVMDKLIEAADGSARKALVVLHAIIGFTDAKKQLVSISKMDFGAQAKDLTKLLTGPTTKETWKKCARILKVLEDDPESLRRMILGYANAILLNAEGKRAEQAYLLIDAFRENTYDSGKAGLSAMCWEYLGMGE